jgi:hypothetical protein
MEVLAMLELLGILGYVEKGGFYTMYHDVPRCTTMYHDV